MGGAAGQAGATTTAENLCGGLDLGGELIIVAPACTATASPRQSETQATK